MQASIHCLAEPSRNGRVTERFASGDVRSIASRPPPGHPACGRPHRHIDCERRSPGNVASVAHRRGRVSRSRCGRTEFPQATLLLVQRDS
jgi:hypothetical protein